MPYNNGVYRSVLDTIALKQLLMPVDIPNPNLNLELFAANEPFNLAYHKYTPKQPSVVLPAPAAIPMEEMGANFTGNPVNAKDFPMEFDLGSPIGGF